MEEKDRKSSQILSIDNESYEIDKLPKEIQELIQGLKAADAQVKMQEDNLKLLIIARKTMTENLRQKLDIFKNGNQK